MAKTLYNCSVDSLYLALHYGWDLTEQHLTAFVAYKSKYTPAFVTTHREALRIAEDMPDQQARIAPTQAQRVDLVAKKEEVLTYFQFLVGYIEDAYQKDKVKIMTQSAGQAKYAKAQNNNWTSVKSLLSSAVAFIENNQADLTADDNMPLDFLTRFKQARADFDALYSLWNTDDSDSYQLTEAKINANNAVYNTILGVLSDAQKVFRNDATKAQKFTFSALLSQIRGTTAAGVSGKVVIKGTTDVLTNATISILSLNKSVQTDIEGRFELSPIAAGFYNIKIEAPDFEPFIMENFEIKIGTIRRLNIEMQAVVTLEAVREMVMV